MGLFKANAPTQLLTAGLLADKHRAFAEAFLDRAKKPGRLEAEKRNATIACAHASLAIFYQRQDPTTVYGDVKRYSLAPGGEAGQADSGGESADLT